MSFGQTCTHKHTCTPDTFLCVGACSSVNGVSQARQSWILVQSTVLSCQFAVPQGAGNSLRHSQFRSWPSLKVSLTKTHGRHCCYTHLKTGVFKWRIIHFILFHSTAVFNTYIIICLWMHLTWMMTSHTSFLLFLFAMGFSLEIYVGTLMFLQGVSAHLKVGYVITLVCQCEE